MYKKGDIVLIPFPFTDLSGVKVRPALVLSGQSKSFDLVVMFITSQSKGERISRVKIVPSDKNGIKTLSYIVCSKIATLDRSIVIGKIGYCESTAMNEVDEQLRQVLGL